MKIIINALAYKQSSSGIGVMIRELFGAYIAQTSCPCTVVLTQDSPVFPSDGVNIDQLRIPCTHSQSLKRMWFQTFRMGGMCRDGVLLTTDSKSPFFLPKSCTLLPLITDLAVFRMGEAYQRSRMLWWRFQYGYVSRRATLFLAISEFTKRDMMDLWHIPEEQIRVVPCACPPHIHREEDPAVLSALRARYALPERFVLFVGNSNPRKNLGRMIQAFDLAKTRGTLPHQLIIAGEQGWKFDRAAAVRGLCHAGDVRFIGFVPDEEMSALYTAAELFVFPTLYEGFGIPVLEAQTCGTPVLASDCTALPEVGGDGALYADPYSPEDISEKLQLLLQEEDLREKLVRVGYENAKRYSWAASAQRLNEIIEGELGK